MVNIEWLGRKWLRSISQYNRIEEEHENAVEFVSHQDTNEAPPHYKSAVLQLEPDAVTFGK
jgi:hypothetical protein